MIRWLKTYWLTALIFCGLFCFYFYVTERGLVNPFLFPKAQAIGHALWQHRVTLGLNVLASMSLMVPSILIALTLAVGLGTLLGLVEPLRKALSPVVYALSVVPSILLSPFALLLAPTFRVASVFLIVYGTLWTTLFATMTGVASIDRHYFDKARTLQLRGPRWLFSVVLPAASPSILGGFVSSLRGTFIMLVYVEMYGTQYGMGYFVKKYSEFGLYAEAWAGFLFLVVVLLVVMALFEALKNRLLRWTM